MGRERPRANARYPRRTIFPLRFVGWMRSVPPFYRGRKRGEVVSGQDAHNGFAGA
ncbi:MAG TPA: hypothetical protein VHZ51_25910 [Ktedonobacteraceae bacterium]|nr:hypothetical protein [Ktedonobacteraceae bacterium]